MVEFHGSHIEGRSKLITVVGDLKKIDRHALAAHGALRQVDVEETFGF